MDAMKLSIPSGTLLNSKLALARGGIVNTVQIESTTRGRSEARKGDLGWSKEDFVLNFSVGICFQDPLRSSGNYVCHASVLMTSHVNLRNSIHVYPFMESFNVSHARLTYNMT